VMDTIAFKYVTTLFTLTLIFIFVRLMNASHCA